VSAAGANESDPVHLDQRRRLQDASERLVVLEQQYARYREVVARAVADEQALASDLDATERECDALSGELEQARQRARQLEAEIVSCLESIASCSSELDQARRASDRESLRNRTLEHRLAATRLRLGLARQTLGELVQTVVRLSYRLERHQSNRPSI
jgi:chromosome segregation ATPase